jgi:hypothetical protein
MLINNNYQFTQFVILSDSEGPIRIRTKRPVSFRFYNRSFAIAQDDNGGYLKLHPGIWSFTMPVACIWA